MLAATVTLLFSSVALAAELFPADNNGPQSQTVESQNKAVQCEVASVHDGDSMRARCPGMKDTVRIRLLQIDAPEIGQAYGIASRDTLRQLCPRGETALFTIVGKDDYERLLAGVTCQNKNVATAMLQSGAAWVYHRYRNDTALKQLEKEAKDKKRGLWGNPNAQAPWNYRRQARN